MAQKIAQTVQMEKLLAAAIKQDAEDILITVGRPPVFRLRGLLHNLPTKVLEPEDTVALMKSITPERYQQELQESGSTDFGFSYAKGVRFRVAAFRQQGLIGVVLRLIPSRLRTFKELGLGMRIQELLYRPRGLILITGPTGSGKTTTLATMIDHININRKLHIITIEDPIEYRHAHKQCVVTQRELGSDVPGFADALRRSLRQAPDVILIGEMRDLESTQLAITAAETGHLVLSTVHTNSAQETVERIIDQFPSGQQQQIRTQLASVFVAALTQTLLPRANGEGLVAGYEILLANNAVRNLIRENKTFRIDSTIQTSRDRGMKLLDDSLLELYAKGIIDRNEVVNRCRYAETVAERLREMEAAAEEE
ncbi:MAG: PilT/PilU family type 4a pilus ATPase [Candidatus Brocadiia bacterium]|nr:PilT/PilU family type 4a pilus ATPase [Candidatus Brocadiia bacterium]